MDASDNSSQQMTEAQRERYIRKKGVTRHIILIRHGQYDETFKVSLFTLSFPFIALASFWN